MPAKIDLPEDEIRDMAAAGWTNNQIAEHFDVSESTVGRYVGRKQEDRLPPGFLFEIPDWMADALCAETDPEIFFPEKGGSTREAKSTCNRCTVAAECFDYAIDHQERFGIWGGVSERDRRRITQLTDTLVETQENAS